jgi:dihydropteroate synthase
VKAPLYNLRAGTRTLPLGERPLLMGVVNASPDSFSDGGVRRDLPAQVELARELVATGADIIDIGGESATTGKPPVAPEEELRRVVPLVERVAAELGVPVSVDSYKPPVARAAIAAGAAIVNDVSGLRDPALAHECAARGAALVLMHTLAPPRVRRNEPDLYDDIVAEVQAFLAERVELALAGGLERDQLILDPGPDFAKTPAQTIELLRGLERLHELGLPLLMAISRKDFIGALTGRAPRARLAGTLAALSYGADSGAHMFRVHDVAEAADFLAVRAALAGAQPPDPALTLPEEVRYEPAREQTSRAGGGRGNR